MGFDVEVGWGLDEGKGSGREREIWVLLRLKKKEERAWGVCSSGLRNCVV